MSSTFFGELSGNDLLRHRDRIKADPEFSSNFAEIVDFSSVSMLSVTKSVLSVLATTESLFNKDVPHVVVTPSDLPMSLALEYRDKVRETRPNFHVVRTIDEARTLLRQLGYEF